MFDKVIRFIREAPSILYKDTRLRLRNSFSFPLVTVGIPLYNEEKYLPDCIESIKRQTYRNWECIVVNDCSTDNSAQVAERLVAGDPRFKIVNHNVNKGLAASRNTALRNAKGKYITFLDSDDFLFPSSIWQRVYALIGDTRPEVAGAFFMMVYCREDIGYSSFVPERFFRNRRKEIDFISSRGECPFNAHAPLLKVSIVRAFSGFNEDMRKGAEDWDLWYRMLRHGYRFIPCYGYGGVYRRKAGSMVKRVSVQHVAEARKLIKSAYEPMTGAPEVEEAPHVFTESLCYYQKGILEAARLIGYAMLTFLGEDEEGTNAILDQLDPSILFLMPHIALDRTLNNFIMRFYCLDEETYNPNAKKYVQIKEEFSQKVIRHLKALNSEEGVV